MTPSPEFLRGVALVQAYQKDADTFEQRKHRRLANRLRAALKARRERKLAAHPWPEDLRTYVAQTTGNWANRTYVVPSWPVPAADIYTTQPNIATANFA